VKIDMAENVDTIPIFTTPTTSQRTLTVIERAKRFYTPVETDDFEIESQRKYDIPYKCKLCFKIIGGKNPYCLTSHLRNIHKTISDEQVSLNRRTSLANEESK
jgi:hypothetical protein